MTASDTAWKRQEPSPTCTPASLHESKQPGHAHEHWTRSKTSLYSGIVPTTRKRDAQSLRKTEGNRSPSSGSPLRRTPQKTTFPRSTAGARVGVQAAHRTRAHSVLPHPSPASDTGSGTFSVVLSQRGWTAGSGWPVALYSLAARGSKSGTFKSMRRFHVPENTVKVIVACFCPTPTLSCSVI